VLYYEDECVRLYCGDSREIVGELEFQSLVTDPVWPNATATIVGIDRPYDLLNEVLAVVPSGVQRMAFQLGCDSDPGLLRGVSLPFFRACWLEMACPHYKGRLLYTSDIAYLYGAPPVSREGRHVIPGKTVSTVSKGKESTHPCPRKLDHVRWIVKWWVDDTDVVCDPFAGSGTTLLACKMSGLKCIGIEIEERFCEMAAKRLGQGILSF